MGFGRRSFLKGLGGALVSGTYLFNEPRVLAGDIKALETGLMLPAEPIIVQATSLPTKIHSSCTAIVYEISARCDPIDITSFGSGKPEYIQDPYAEVDLHMKMFYVSTIPNFKPGDTVCITRVARSE